MAETRRPERILLVHNAYQQRGGEDMVAEAEAALLRAHGHAVIEYRRHNDEIAGQSRADIALQTLWSRRTMREMGKLLDDELPDVVHVHNTFPLISPSLYTACAQAGVPVVQTLHNFRLLCPQAMFLREGRVCEDCLGRLPWRGAVRGCYRDSRLQSTVLTGMLLTHRALGTWQQHITRYIALNDFCRDKFIAGGLPAERISVKPNFVDFALPPPGTRKGFLFVGRLSPEKGVSVLGRATRMLDSIELRVAGTGPEAAALADLPGVDLLGGLDMGAVYRQMCRSEALVLPSIWYENFPRTLVEAYACGLPVIASRIGALAELVRDGETGLLFEPGDPSALATCLRWAQAHPREMAAMGQRARARYEAEFTGERNYGQLMTIYRQAMAETPASQAA